MSFRDRFNAAKTAAAPIDKPKPRPRPSPAMVTPKPKKSKPTPKPIPKIEEIEEDFTAFDEIEEEETKPNFPLPGHRIKQQEVHRAYYNSRDFWNLLYHIIFGATPNHGIKATKAEIKKWMEVI
jgi:hypothetical protein